MIRTRPQPLKPLLSHFLKLKHSVFLHPSSKLYKPPNSSLFTLLALCDCNSCSYYWARRGEARRFVHSSSRGGVGGRRSPTPYLSTVVVEDESADQEQEQLKNQSFPTKNFDLLQNSLSTMTPGPMDTQAPLSAWTSDDEKIQYFDNAFLTAPTLHPDENIAVIILNNACLKNTLLFRLVWTRAAFRACADGGANRLFDNFAESREEYIPNAIKGDLDSLRPDVREFYGSRGVSIEKDPDQDSNDLDKCLNLLVKAQEVEARKGPYHPFTVLIFGAFGGRFDQEMQNINALFRWRSKFRRMMLLSEDTFVFSIPAGQTIVRSNFSLEGRTCGLIPFGAPSQNITTKGLKWNLKEQDSFFGGLVSTSNAIEQDEVFVQTSAPMLWTTEVLGACSSPAADAAIR